MNKLVSVIIPSYNHQNFIKECVESVINQTYKNLEIIIQDDCSTDNTMSELKKIKDKRIKLIFSKKNKGVVDTLNDLIKLCTGEYIAVIGSDDVWYPTKIEKQLKIFEEKSNIGCVFTDVDIIDESSMLYDDEDSDFFLDIFKTENVSRSQHIRSFYEVGNYLCHSSSLMPRSIVEEIGNYNKTYRQLHDFDYWTRVICKYDIFIIKERLMGYRRIRNNVKSVSCESDENIIRTINEMYSIKYNMIMNLDNKLFKDSFGDSFRNGSSKNNEEIFCEKFFVLLNLSCADILNNSYAFQLLFDYTDKDKIFEVLEKKFNYYLKDFYNDTGSISKNNNIIYVKKYKELEYEKKQLLNKIDDLLNSNSWKLTKPIRLFSSMLKKMRCKKDDT